MARTSDDYTSCLVINAKGAMQRGSVQKEKMMSVPEAVQAHVKGNTAWIMPGSEEMFQAALAVARDHGS